jgi:hypothetical protein
MSVASSAPQTRTVMDNRGINLISPLRTLAGGLVWGLLALVFNILIEWLGIFFGWWELPGDQHSAEMLNQEIGWLNDDFKHVIGDPISNVPRIAGKIHTLLFVWNGHDYSNEFLGYANGFGAVDYASSAINSIHLFGVRVGLMLFSLPVFVAFGVVAFTDGLLQRDLRRFGGGRESAYLWHYAKRWIAPTLTLPIVLYLGLPFSIYPPFLIVPFAMLFGFAIWISSALFKKYL